MFKSENNEADEVKKVAQTLAFFYAIGGVFLLLLTLRFVGELLGIVSPQPADDSFFGSLIGLLYSAGLFIGSVLAVLLFGGVTLLFFAQVIGLWRLKRWSLHITAASTVLFFVFTLSLIADANVSPYLGITSVISGGVLAYLYHHREHFN